MSKVLKNIPNNKPKNISEPIKKLLELVNNEHNHDKAPDIYSYSTVLRQLKNTDMKNLDESIENCLSTFRCHHCQKPSKYFLACKHLICETCMESCFSDIEKFLIDPAIFYCPFCQFEHTTRDMNRIVPERWNSLLNDVKTQKIQRGLEKVCQKCKIQKNCSEFPQISACGSHETCLECLAEAYLNGKFSCVECRSGEKFKFNIAPVKGCCSVCRQSVYYVGDYLTSICDSHLHCFECLKKAREQGRCKACGLKLDIKSTEKIDHKLWKQCAMCKTQFESSLIIKKICCDSNICLFCQCRDREMCFKCVNCEQTLIPSTLELVLETQSVIDNFNP